MTQLTGWLVVV